MEAGKREMDVLRPGQCGASIGKNRSNNICGAEVVLPPQVHDRTCERVNAARQMLRVFLHMLSHNKEQPAAFKHRDALNTNSAPGDITP